MTGRLMTAREVSEVVGHSPATVLRWAREGKLPAVRLPSNAIRFVPEEFERWMRARSTGAGVGSGGYNRPRLAAVPAREEN
jgi:excisionase family DNA binding protein